MLQPSHHAPTLDMDRCTLPESMYTLDDRDMTRTPSFAGAIAIGDYTEAATVVVLFGVADFLEANCCGKARDAIAAVLALKPETAILADTGVWSSDHCRGRDLQQQLSITGGDRQRQPRVGYTAAHWGAAELVERLIVRAAVRCGMMETIVHAGEEVESETLGVGALINVRPGDCVAVDGVVTRGASAVDESMLTGEAAPVAKGAGDAVSSGTLNVGGSTLEVRAHPVRRVIVRARTCNAFTRKAACQNICITAREYPIPTCIPTQRSALGTTVDLLHDCRVLQALL